MKNEINESIRIKEDQIVEAAEKTENNIATTKKLKKYSIASKK